MIRYYRKMKEVERLNGKFKHRPYNLLEHCYMVTVLFRYFASKEDVAYGNDVIDMVLHHDIVETVTDDLSYTVKNHSPVTKSSWEAIEDDLIKSNPKLRRYSDSELKSVMSPLQHRLFKACDLLDLWIFLKEEIAYGNKSMEIIEITERCEGLLKGQFKTIDKFIETYEA